MAVGAVAVVGSGPVAVGLLDRIVAAGFPVRVTDLAAPPPERVRSVLGRRLAEATAEGHLPEARAAAIAARVETSPEALAIEECDLVLEAVADGLHEKARLLRGLEADMSRGAVLAACSRTLPVDRFASRLSRPEQFLAVGLPLPVADARHVELRPTAKTAPGAVEAVRNFFRALGIAPVDALPVRAAPLAARPSGWHDAAADGK